MRIFFCLEICKILLVGFQFVKLSYICKNNLHRCLYENKTKKYLQILMTARCVKINVSLFCLYKYIFKFYSTNISLKTCKFWSFSLFENAPKMPNLVYVEMKVVNGLQEKTLIRIWLGKERINRFITGSNIQIKSRHYFFK